MPTVGPRVPAPVHVPPVAPAASSSPDSPATRLGGPRQRWLAVVALLVALPLTALGPVVDTQAGTWWPGAGIAAAAVLLAPRRAWWAVGLLVVVVLVAPITWVYDTSPVGAAFFASALAVPALCCATALRPPADAPDGDRQLLTGFDSARYHLVLLGSATLAAALVAVMSAAYRGPLVVLQLTISSSLGALTSLLVVLPLLAPDVDRPPSGGKVELAVQRTALVAMSLLLLLLPVPEALCTAIFPVLGWAALRASRRETVLQLFAFAVAAYVTTVLGLGVMTTSSAQDLPEPLRAVPLHLFLASLAYLIVPLALAVERLSTVSAQAVRSARTMERMLDGASTSLIVVTDGQGRIIQFSTGAQRILGYRPAEVLGRSPAMFHRQEELERLAAEAGTAADVQSLVLHHAQHGLRREWEFLRADGTTCMVALSLNVVDDAEGRAAMVLSVGDDVTERLRERRLMEVALEREHQSVMRLQEVDHVKQELVSNVSHELRTPITSIAGYAELLADHSLGELTRQQRDALARIERNALRLQSLVDDLLTLSRSEAGRLQLARTPVDLADVVRTAWELFEEQLRRRDLDASLVLPPAPVTVLGDTSALERVVVNLVSNAVKFTPDGGTVTVTVTRTSDGAARLMVRDSGIGIDADDQAKLFTRFFRSRDATDQAIQGTGLGLSIVQALVSQHGGQVSVRSRPGEGTRVTVEIPTA